jgi:hypothetical protein
MAPTPTQWNDALEKRFLLEVITLANGANMATFDVIAKKWGGSHTKGSLKYVRSYLRLRGQKPILMV